MTARVAFLPLFASPLLPSHHRHVSAPPPPYIHRRCPVIHRSPCIIRRGRCSTRRDPRAAVDPPPDALPPPPPSRPAWAPPWLPQPVLDLRTRPWLQLAVAIPLYLLHLFCFATRSYTFARPLLPNSRNLFRSLGYDSVAGVLVLVTAAWWRRRYPSAPLATPTSATSQAPAQTLPWQVPRSARRRIAPTTLLLLAAYLASGYAAVLVESALFFLAGSGVPLTTATARAWKVLLSHLAWVYMGIAILRSLRPFFPPDGKWFTWRWRDNWLWWTVGGYYISPLFFNFADVLNQLLLPKSLFDTESVVSKLINPENKDLVAMAVGSVGPCITAPVFEEVVYRGYLLPALTCFLPVNAAIPVSAVLFAVNHLNPTSFLPLTMLGLVWAIIYARSRNLTVTILIHAMWNSRVFLGSLLGLGTFTDFE